MYDVLNAAVAAAGIMVDPFRLGVLALGVVMGLVLGILPGVGGLTGIAILLPFTFGMDPYTAFAFLLGLLAVISTGDPIPAILFGVPGGAGSQATVLDGLPMARRGEAGRALSAAYVSSLMGGLFGAAVLAMSLPLLRPLMMHLGSAELLAFAIFGISMVSILSGTSPARGLAMACLGMLIALIGTDPHSGTMRWTMGTLYLWEGIPIVPMVLGFFALPELADLAIRRTSISGTTNYSTKGTMFKGVADCFRNWFLVIRCGVIGAMVGVLPGLGASVVDWLAYGHAYRTEKGAAETFGKGDVRGVIAPEAANNSKEGGSLVPTIAFGVPGSASMALLLAAFQIHGLVPGPDMLDKNLDVTFSMIWSLAIANVLGAGLCFAFSGYFARIALLRYVLIIPAVLTIIYVGAFQSTRSWGDIYVLIGFGVLGWLFRSMRWPRPPLILGFVLGAFIERYFGLSMNLYGWSWLTRPIIMVVLLGAAYILLRPLAQVLIANRRSVGGVTFHAPRVSGGDVPYVAMMIVFALAIWSSSGWVASARNAPMMLASVGLILVTIGLASRMTTTKVGPSKESYMDLAAEYHGLSRATVLTRAFYFIAWLLGFMASMAVIGLLPTIPFFAAAYLRLEGGVRWRTVATYAAGLTTFVYVLFDHYLAVPWPPALIDRLGLPLPW